MTVVEIVFRILNFITLIALFIYLYKKYVAQGVKNQIEQQDALQERLLSRQEQLETESHLLDQKIVYEEALCAQLTDKVVQWAAIIEEEKNVRQSEKDRIAYIIIDSLKLQEQNKANENFFCYVQKQVALEVKKKLEKKFMADNEQKAYIKMILSYMKEQAK